MKQLIRLSVSDFKLIFRDASLRTFLFLPILIFVVVIVVLPLVKNKFEVVAEYIPFVLIVATIEVTQMFGFIYAVMLIEEKEMGVSHVYGVLPISKMGFSLMRQVIPVLITILITWALLMTQPFYNLPFLSTLGFSMLSGLIVPPYALGVSILCKNKMEGLIWVKVFNLIVVIPVIAFFIPPSYTFLFTILPTHWAFQGLNHLILGEAFLLELGIGTVFLIALTALTARLFVQRHYA